MSKVLILGKRPPPIGGVTVHVARLVAALKKRDFRHFEVCDTSWKSFLKIVPTLLSSQVIHLHISNPYFQLAAAAFCKLSRKKLLITYHGNWGRYHLAGNLAVSLSAWLAEIPIVQNADSYAKAVYWNRNAALISTYIPGNQHFIKNTKLENQLLEIKKRYSNVFCTNAWNVTFHKYGQETYGISELIARMKAFPQCALIVSDPSGNYVRYLSKIKVHIPDNIFLISYPHDFRQILTFASAFIRNTVTDGVSLSIHEALEMDVPVFASNAVSRPTGCYTYHDLQELNFVELLGEAETFMKKAKCLKREDPVEQLIALYKSCLNNV